MLVSPPPPEKYAPFAWGPQGDRIALGGLEVRGVAKGAPDLPSVGAEVGAFDLHVLETGRITFTDKADVLLNDPRIREAYLGH